jgi:hypothetical protein
MDAHDHAAGSPGLQRAADAGLDLDAVAQRLQRSPHFLRMKRRARATGDIGVLEAYLAELRRDDDATHAVLVANRAALMRLVNADEAPAADGTTAELRLLWTALEGATEAAQEQRAAAQRAREQAAAAAQQRDAAEAAQLSAAAETEAALRAQQALLASATQLARAHEAAAQRARAHANAADKARVTVEAAQRATAAQLEAALQALRAHGIPLAPADGASHAAAAEEEVSLLQPAGVAPQQPPAVPQLAPAAATGPVQPRSRRVQARLMVSQAPAATAGIQPAPAQAAAGAPGGRVTASEPPPDMQRFAGVVWNAQQRCWQVQYQPGGQGAKVYVGYFPVGEEVTAAHAYDAAARAAGGTVVNFPRPGTAETRAAFRLRATNQQALAGIPQARNTSAGAVAPLPGPPGGVASLAAAAAGGAGAALLGSGERDRKRLRVAETRSENAGATQMAHVQRAAVQSARDEAAAAAQQRDAAEAAQRATAAQLAAAHAAPHAAAQAELGSAPGPVRVRKQTAVADDARAAAQAAQFYTAAETDNALPVVQAQLDAGPRAVSVPGAAVQLTSALISIKPMLADGLPFLRGLPFNAGEALAALAGANAAADQVRSSKLANWHRRDARKTLHYKSKGERL